MSYEDIARKDKQLVRIVCCLCAFIFLFTVVLEPMQAQAVAIGVGLLWLFFIACSIIGISVITYESIDNQTPLTDFKLNIGGSNRRLIDVEQMWYDSLAEDVKAAADSLANGIATSGKNFIEVIGETKDKLALVIDSVREFMLGIFGGDTAADIPTLPPLQAAVNAPVFDSTLPEVPGEFIIEPDPTSSVGSRMLVNGVQVPVGSGSYVYFTPNSTVSSSTSFSSYLNDVFGSGYDYCNVYFLREFGLKTYLKYSRDNNDTYSVSLYMGEQLLGSQELATLGYSTSSPFSNATALFYWIVDDSIGESFVRVRTNITMDNEDYQVRFDLPSDNPLSQLVTWANQQFQLNNPSRYINGTGALAWDFPDVSEEVLNEPDPPDDGEDEEPKPDVIWFPWFPTREDPDDPEAEPETVTEPGQVVWNDAAEFTQAETLEGYDQNPSSGDNPDGEDGGGNLTTNITPPASLGLDSIWYYVTETYDYVKGFFETVKTVYDAIPQPVMYLAWADVVLIIVFGIYRRVIS